MRLIDADALVEAMLEARREETDTVLKLIRFIEKQPTIEPKRGRWEIIDVEEPRRYGCSRCKCLSWDTDNFCPNCGARMGADA